MKLLIFLEIIGEGFYLVTDKTFTVNVNVKR